MYRSGLVAAVVVEAAVLGLAGLAAAGVRAVAPGPPPDRPTARVTACELGAYGAAEVTYAVTNHDVTVHGYRVQLVVSAGSTRVGEGVSLVNGVLPGGTATGRALVPVRPGPAGATCAVRADVYDGQTGHHGH